jgi:hypothetical protein
VTPPRADALIVLVTDWYGRFPGNVELCAGCDAPLEVLPGQTRVGAYLYHLSEPDLFCEECVAASCEEPA